LYAAQEHETSYSGSLFFLSGCITFCMILWLINDYMPRFLLITCCQHAS
jgi:hypothetical protein